MVMFQYVGLCLIIFIKLLNQFRCDFMDICIIGLIYFYNIRFYVNHVKSSILVNSLIYFNILKRVKFRSSKCNFFIKRVKQVMLSHIIHLFEWNMSRLMSLIPFDYISRVIVDAHIYYNDQKKVHNHIDVCSSKRPVKATNEALLR